jgi:hypothetical protein
MAPDFSAEADTSVDCFLLQAQTSLTLDRCDGLTGCDDFVFFQIHFVHFGGQDVHHEVVTAVENVVGKAGVWVQAQNVTIPGIFVSLREVDDFPTSRWNQDLQRRRTYKNVGSLGKTTGISSELIPEVVDSRVPRSLSCFGIFTSSARMTDSTRNSWNPLMMI